MRAFFLLCTAAFFFAIPGGFAQKIEKERRVDREILPARMLEHLQDHYPEKRRVRYYLEENEDGSFYEAKFKYRGHLYSVKYYPDGRLFDTEREIKFKSIPSPVFQLIEKAFSQRLQRFKIIKVQEQLENEAVTGYEIEVRGKSSDHLGYFEAHFESDGTLTDIQTIEQRPNDFLFF